MCEGKGKWKVGRVAGVVKKRSVSSGEECFEVVRKVCEVVSVMKGLSGQEECF